MGDKTQIAWADATWNPVTGCTKVSPGCAYCYIERTPPFRMEGRRFERSAIPVRLHPDRLDQPLRWREPRRVFVCSMGDLFHEDVPDEFISYVFAVASMATRHTFLILTKRAERMAAYLKEMASDPDAYVYAWAREASSVFLDGKPALSPVERWPLPNVWLGISAENQRMADERIPLLLNTPAAMRFVSVEPMLGAVDLDRWLTSLREHGPALDWVIVGGESGPQHRPLDLAWVRDLKAQCDAADVAFFMKQDCGATAGRYDHLPEDLKVREFPDAR